MHLKQLIFIPEPGFLKLFPAPKYQTHPFFLIKIVNKCNTLFQEHVAWSAESRELLGLRIHWYKKSDGFGSSCCIYRKKKESLGYGTWSSPCFLDFKKKSNYVEIISNKYENISYCNLIHQKI